MIITIDDVRGGGADRRRGRADAVPPIANAVAADRRRRLYHARRLSIPVTVVMPNGTPRTKISRTEGFGATVILHGGSFAEASEAVPEFVAQGLTFCTPSTMPER